METFTVRTENRLAVQDVTAQVREAVPSDTSRTCTVFVRHTTAASTVNEAEERLLGDLEDALEDLVPDEGWAHDELDDNADSHVRAMLVGPSGTILVENGEPALGTWQSVLLVECDGPGTRTVCVATG